MKKGFTLLEMLVASCLLGILVTILTMVFNQSAIAWRTGKGSVADMSEGQMNLSAVGFLSDNIIPGLKNASSPVCVVSPWDDADTDGSDRQFAQRGIRTIKELIEDDKRVSGDVAKNLAHNVALFNVGGKGKDFPKSDWVISAGGSFQQNSVKNYVVGVKSYGPDGVEGTKDDITTWPTLQDSNEEK